MTGTGEPASQRAGVAEWEEDRDAPASGARWRAFASALCIVVATILVPVAIVAAWVRAELVDADRFVATFAPLVQSVEVQDLLIAEATAVIDEQLDVTELTDSLFDGIATLDLPDRALSAIDLLRAPAAAGLRGFLDDAVGTVVRSDAFADVWAGTLRMSHRALASAATGSASDGILVIDDAGLVGIQLGPVVAEVKQRLVDMDVGFAAMIPAVDRTIVLVESDALVGVQLGYRVAVDLGWWLPLIAGVLFATGVLLARRRSTGLLGAGIGLGSGGAMAAAGLGLGEYALALAAAGLEVPGAALGVVYAHVVSGMRQTAFVVVVVGAAAAVLAWSQGRWRAAVAVRTAVGGVNRTVRAALDERGLAVRAGDWLQRRRQPVRGGIAAAAVVFLALIRPLTASGVVAILLMAVLLWWFSEILRRPAEAAGASARPH